MTPVGTSACQPTQVERILAALRRGPVNPVDFSQVPTIDGHAPILRLAARIETLRKQGHRIESAKQPNRTVTYTLVFDAELDVERHDTEPTWEARGERRSLTGGVVSLGAPSPQGSDGCPSLLRPSEPAPLFDWRTVAA